MIPEETAIPFWATTDRELLISNTTNFYVNCALIANSWDDAQFNGAAAQNIANEIESNFILQKS